MKKNVEHGDPRAELRKQVTVEDVGPELAEKWLKRNIRNRTMKTSKIDAMAQDMQQGNFRFNGASICFSDEGVLLDGQNRLAAIVKSGRTYPFIIVRGLVSNAQDTMDTGSSRSYSDVLKIRGYPHYVGVASSVRTINAYESGSTTLRRRIVSNTSLDATLAKHPEIVEQAPAANYVATKVPGVGVGPIGLAMSLFSRVDEEDCTAFFERLASGAGLDTGDPILALRTALQKASDEQVRTGGFGIRPHIAVGLIFKAWNKWRDGDTCSRLTFKPGGANPDKLPIPH